MDAMKTIDMVEELRLRCWAREHYVLPTHRDDSWHPIILDEMRTRDKELSRRDNQLSRREKELSLPPLTHTASPTLSVVYP